jgi:hypothetical protein
MGFSIKGTIGLGRSQVKGRSLAPSPPAMITAFNFFHLLLTIFLCPAFFSVSNVVILLLPLLTRLSLPKKWQKNKALMAFF